MERTRDTLQIDHFAFSAEQVCHLTGLTKRQLGYWDSTDFFSPTLASQRDRVYSFRDLVGLRTIGKLRQEVLLQELRKVGAWLLGKHDSPWASLRFYLSGRTVRFRDPGSGRVVSTKPRGQTVCIEMDEIVDETRELVRQRHRRDDSAIGRIVRSRSVVQNEPVFAGTRIRVEAIWNYCSAGYSPEQIRAEYPSLSQADIDAAIAYQRESKQSLG